MHPRNIFTLTCKRRLCWILAFVFPLAFYVFLISQTPSIYGWDAFTRLWEHRTLFVRHWLPLPQFPVVIVTFFHGSLFVLRCVYATAAVIGAVTLGLFVSRHCGNRTGLTVSFLIAFLPTFAHFSIVPYQESFLLFCLGFFLYTWDIATANARKWPIVASSLFIVLAELCRYEAWIFAAMMACGIIMRRQWKFLPILIPALILPLMWVLTSSYRDVSYGFLTSAKLNPFRVASLPFEFSTLFWMFGSVSIKVIIHAGYVLSWIGLPLMILGIVASWKKRGIIGRELLLFLVALFLLSIIRGVNTGGLTSRIPVLFLCIGVLYLAIGLNNIKRFLPETIGKMLNDGVTLGIACTFLLQSYHMAKTSSDFFSPEAQAAILLTNLSEKISGQEHVVIIPRTVANPWGESAISAIFANSMKLDPNDSRWVYQGSDTAKLKKTAGYVLSFDYETKKYTLTKKPP